MTTKMRQPGIDEIRSAREYFGWQNETFNERFTAEELLNIWRYALAHPAEVPEMADTWPAWRIQDALGREIKTRPIVCKACKTEDCAGFYIDPVNGAVWPCGGREADYGQNAEGEPLTLQAYVHGFVIDMNPHTDADDCEDEHCPGWAVFVTNSDHHPPYEIERCDTHHGARACADDEEATTRAIRELSAWLGYRVDARLPPELVEDWGVPMEEVHAP